MEALLVFLARLCVAGAFTLSAAWKVRNRAAFVASLRSSAPWIPSGAAVRLSTVVAVVEVVLAVALWAVDGPVPAIAAGVVLVVLTGLLLAAPDLSQGCGCWQAPRVTVGKAAYVARNGVLLALLAVGSIPVSGEVSFGEQLALAVMAVPVALLIMEATTLVQALRSTDVVANQALLK